MGGVRGQIRTGGDEGAKLQAESAHRAAGGALFWHRYGRPRRQRASFVRRARFRRHAARDGGGLEQRQSRPRQRRRDRARSGRAERDAAALPASRRPFERSSRSRQCRRAARRLHARGVVERRCFGRGRRDAEADVARQGARRGERSGHRKRRRQRHRSGERQRSVGLCARTQLRAHGEGAGANLGAAHGAVAWQRPKPDAVERYVCRSRSRHRQRLDLGRLLDRARCGEPARGAQALSVPLFGADHEPRLAAALRQRPGQPGARCARPRHRAAHSQRHRRAADAAGHRPVRSVCGASAATISGSTPT